TTCCSLRNRPNNSSAPSRWRRSRFICAPMPPRRSPAPTCRSTGVGRRSKMARAKSQPRKKINLALQGGGAHGAFTWGVLDHLLQDERLAIEGISGASAGALNAVMLADGLARGGREEARKRLADFWRGASGRGHLAARPGAGRGRRVVGF